MTGQPNDDKRLFMIWTICLLMGVIAELIGLVAGAFCDMQLGTFLVPCLTIPMLIFSGFFIKFKELFHCFKAATYLSFFRYSFEGSVQSIYGYNRTNLNCTELFCYYKDPKKFLHDMDMEKNNYSLDLIGLGVWIILLQILLYIALKIKLIKAQ